MMSAQHSTPLAVEPSPSWCGPRLRITTVQGPAQHSLEVELSVADGASVVVGRGPDAALALPDQHVSRSHLILTRQGEEITARDAGSRWGSRHNGRVLQGECVLNHGDVLVIGSTIMRFERYWDLLTRPGRLPANVPAARERDDRSEPAVMHRPAPQARPLRPPAPPPPPPAAWEQNLRIAALLTLALCGVYFILLILRLM